MIFLYLLYFLSLVNIISSSSWFSLWVSLELNVFIFCFMMLTGIFVSLPFECIFKYFIIQVVSSMIILFTLVYCWVWWLTILAVLMKLGSFPFHGWVLNLIKFFTPLFSLVFLTFQKLPLLYLITYFPGSSSLMFYVVIFNMIVGALGGYYYSGLLYLMVFSSFSHMGWLMLFVSSSLKMFFQYFIIYLWLSILVFLYLNKVGLLTFEYQMFSIVLPLMIMLGFPPFPVFFMKWTLMNYFSSLGMLIVLFVSAITIYLYLRAIFLYGVKSQNNFGSTKFNLLGFGFVSLVLLV